MAGNARPSDEPDATGKGLEREAGSEGLPGSSPALPDAALRSEWSLDYRAGVDAVYRRYDMDHDHGAPREPKRETAIFAMRRSEAEDRHRYPAGPGSHTNGMARLAEAVDCSAAASRGGSGPSGHGGTNRDPVLPDDGGHDPVLSRDPDRLGLRPSRRNLASRQERDSQDHHQESQLAGANARERKEREPADTGPRAACAGLRF
jgi:hypothetical protein